MMLIQQSSFKRLEETNPLSLNCFSLSLDNSSEFSSLPQSDVVVLMFSVDDRASFEEIEEYYLPQVEKKCPDAARLVLILHSFSKKKKKSWKFSKACWNKK